MGIIYLQPCSLPQRLPPQVHISFGLRRNDSHFSGSAASSPKWRALNHWTESQSSQVENRGQVIAFLNLQRCCSCLRSNPFTVPNSLKVTGGCRPLLISLVILWHVSLVYWVDTLSMSTGVASHKGRTSRTLRI